MGGILAASISSPIVSLPLAFASHYVMDYLPHFGQKYGHRDEKFKYAVGIDIVLLAILITYLVLQSQWMILLGGLVAMSPDFVWIYRFILVEKFGTIVNPPKMLRINQFHVDIQKQESNVAYIVDTAFLLVGLTVLWAVL